MGVESILIGSNSLTLKIFKDNNDCKMKWTVRDRIELMVAERIEPTLDLNFMGLMDAFPLGFLTL